jgi:hypothetical protein
MEIKWIEYKGHKILVTDYRGGKNEDELKKTLYAAEEEIKKHEKGIHMGGDFMKELNRIGKETFRDYFTKIAVVGLFGIQKVLARAYNKISGTNEFIAWNEEEAKKWLIK